MPMPTRNSATELLAMYPHLTPRDRSVMALLDEHQALRTDQVHRLHFQALRTCQIRLAQLWRLGPLERFRFANPDGGSMQWLWTLGLAGARFQAAANARPAPSVRAHRERLLRLSASPNLPHLLATNEFFIRLAHAARADSGLRLDRWWSERVSTGRYLRIKPDGHGLWTAGDVTTGFYLECDRGTEGIARLVAKLDAYARLTRSGGPRYPVLFWLPSTDREGNLQQELRRARLPVPVATATHDADPAKAVWLAADGWRRVTLAELPSDHGLDSIHNPNWRDGQLDLSNQPDLRT